MTCYYHSRGSEYPDIFFLAYQTVYERSNEMRESITKVPTSSRMV